MPKAYGFKSKNVAEKLRDFAQGFPSTRSETKDIPEGGTQAAIYVARVPTDTPSIPNATINNPDEESTDPVTADVTYRDCEIYKFVELSEEDGGGWKLEPLYDREPDGEVPEDEGEIAFRPVFNIFGGRIDSGTFFPVIQEITRGRFISAAPPQVQMAILTLGPNDAIEEYPPMRGEENDGIWVVPSIYPVSSIDGSNVPLGLTDEQQNSFIVHCGQPFYIQSGAVVFAINMGEMNVGLSPTGWILFSAFWGFREFVLKGTLNGPLSNGGSAEMLIDAEEDEDEETVTIFENTGLSDDLPEDTVCWVRYNFKRLKWILERASCAPPGEEFRRKLDARKQRLALKRQSLKS